VENIFLKKASIQIGTYYLTENIENKGKGGIYRGSVFVNLENTIRKTRGLGVKLRR